MSELRKQTLFRRFAFILLFVILAGSLAGVGSLLFSNSSITDETGRGEAEVEVAAITGSGTQASPWVITTKADLQAWAGSSTYWAANTYTQLAADIDWGGSGGGNWTYDINYQGNFDGKQHVIKNFYISKSGTAGFFTTAIGVIQNLGFVNGAVVGSSGGIVGTIVGSVPGTLTLTNCFNTGTVTGNGALTGGLVGKLTSGTLTFRNCFNSGAIAGGASITGGIFGQCQAVANLVMDQCFNSGAISNTNSSSIGGLSGSWNIGTNSSYYFVNCYNTGTITSSANSSSSGGIQGYNNGSEIVSTTTGIKNCYSAGSVTSGTALNGYCNSSAETRNNYYDSNKNSRDCGSSSHTSNVALTTATMTANAALSSMSNLSTSYWYKRPNESSTDQTKMYYPELKVFAEHSWKALQEYSKASVKMSGPTDPGYKRNDAPTCTANTAVNDVPWIGNGTK